MLASTESLKLPGLCEMCSKLYAAPGMRPSRDRDMALESAKSGMIGYT